VFWELVSGANYFFEPSTDALMRTFPFLRFIPGKNKQMFDQVTAAKERILKRYIYGQKVIDINRQLLKLFSFLITISYSDELDFQIDCFNILK